MSHNVLKYFFYLTIACSPLYMLRFSIFRIPLNILDTMMLFCIFLFFIYRKNFTIENVADKNKKFFIGISLIILGIVSSFIYNSTYLVSLGILKSWFIIPFIFSFIFIQLLKNFSDIRESFLIIYSSVFIIAIISLVYKFSNLVTYDKRLSAFYDSPNQLAMFLVFGVFLGYFFLNTFLTKKEVFFFKIFFLFSFSIILLTLYFTFSYGVWVSILLSFGIITLVQKKSSFKKISSFLFILTIFLFLITIQLSNQKLSSLISFSERSSLQSRIMIWKSSIKMLGDNPFFGIGAGSFQKNYLLYQKYFPPYLEWAVPEPHNLYLAIWLQAGFLGLLGFFLIFYTMFSKLFLMLKKEQTSSFAYPLLGIFFYILLHGLIDTPFWKNDLALFFWIFIFLTINIYLKSFSKKNSKVYSVNLSISSVNKN